MNKKYRHIEMNGNRLKGVLMTAMLLMSGTAMADETGGVHVGGNVFGGGNLATVGGNVTVNIKAGTIEKDVYGGGALANTNINNIPAESYTGTGTEEGNTFTYTTTVNLTGGTIQGDAYGGGLGHLGDSPIEAMVYGDVNVTLGSEGGSTATAFNISHYGDDSNTSDVDESTIIKSGRVFGCNNRNGSPLGNVTVTVWKTAYGNVHRSESANKSSNSATYELAAVYGGGNMANYTATGKKTHVIINGCSNPSIEYVYGGGNAAAVPEASVDVNGAYEIGYVFGGGNGADKYTLNGTDWIDNPGANVNGDATTMLYGGTIHEAFGGSNEKGTISGNVSINSQSGGSCDLSLGKLYGAGRNADINGDLIVVMGCMPGDDNKTDEVYGGAENANVKGNVELTITSGSFHKVFGGNNKSGAIFGHIIVNIEETGCNPIKIDELYLGGNEAAYSVYGYYKDTSNNNKLKPRTSEDDTYTAEDNPAEDATHSFPYADPVLNIISCTRIGKVFGGGWGTDAVMYGNPTVNINQIYGTPNNTTSTSLGSIGVDESGSSEDCGVFGGGNQAQVVGNTTINIGTETTIQLHQSYDKTTKEYAMSGDQTMLGANILCDVYGGGNLADVTGNTLVNICAKKSGDEYTPVAEGASKVTIAGDVFGGGKGEATTFTCEKAMIGIEGAGVDTENYPDGYPNGRTAVIIGNGTVNGNVYGGGKIARVEMNTSVTIGIGDGVATGTPTSAPEIKHSVFGGGKGLTTHGYSALVRGNPTVVIQGNAKVRKNVYGGGEIASVARYNVAQTDEEGAPYGVKKDMPYALKTNDSGLCTVTVRGNAEIGPETIGEETTTSAGHVFGAGKGILPGGDYAFAQGTTKRMVLNDDKTASIWETFQTEADYITFVKTLALSSQTRVTIDGNATVKGSVFGGSESGFVQFDTNVNVTGGTIGVEGKGGADFGNVYGGGKGDVEYTGTNNDYITAGIVKGNTKVAISQATGNTTQIYHNIYGGGAYGTVGEFEYDSTTGLPTVRKTYTIGTDVHSTTGGNTEVYITGGTIGTNGDENGMVFGSSRGDVGATGSIHDKAAWVYDTHVAIGDTTATTTTTTTPLIKGSIYGGGENGHNLHSSFVRINGGTIGITEGEPIGSYTSGGASYPYRGNVYGGGCGTDKYDNDTKYNPLAGIVRGDATIRMTAGIVAHNIYGAGAMGSVGTTNADGTVSGGTTTINISGGTLGVDGNASEGNVFGAARGASDESDNSYALVSKSTSVSITGGILHGNVYGGGELGYVGKFTSATDATSGSKTYTWPTGTGVCNVTVNGGSASVKNVFGAGKGSPSTFECEPAMVYKTNVSISKGTVNGNVYGGGELGRVENNTTVTIGPDTGDDAPDIKGDVFGAGAGVATHGYSALVRGDATVTVQGKAKVAGCVYGGGQTASVGKFKVVGSLPKEPLSGGTCKVTIQGDAQIGTGSAGGNVFGACKGVTPSFVASGDNRSQHMDNTNTLIGFDSETDYNSFLKTLALTSNTEVTIAGNTTVYGSVYGGGQRGITLGKVDVDITGGTIEEDVYGGGALADTNTGNWDADGSKWTDDTKKTALYTTTVDLTGGTIKGDAYGGGLGQKTGFNGATGNIEAVVWGDIKVTLGTKKASAEDTNPTTATSFYINYYEDDASTTDVDESKIVKSGRVFGCNNLNGSPQGNVTVDVWKTVTGKDKDDNDVTRTEEDPDNTGMPKKGTDVTSSYELAAVYGGGNLADYTTSGKKTNVIIETCDISIQDVYGGGNAAKVPATDVLIKGAYEIQEVFGGGNGKDPYTTDGGTNWTPNPGADIDGNAMTLMTGGYIHEAYGGSNKKGTITGNVTIDVGPGDSTDPNVCDLDVEKMVGAGKDADVNGDLIMVLGCKPNSIIPVLYAGADNANVNGDVELTITSGRYGQVFGGNNKGGIIMGHIKLNIEETGNCDVPIEIDELYLGGNMATYSMYGYYNGGSASAPDYKARTAEMAAITDPTATGYTPAITAADYGGTTIRKTAPYDAPVLNVISCTRIGKVYGGGYGVGGDMHANPTVNINMIPGSNASAIKRNGSANEHDLGEIGDVYGGGDAADVYGNTTINIGTESTVTMTSIKDEDGTQLSYNVEGAYITGNIYGGGNKAAIHGSTEVNICAKKVEQTVEGETTVNYQAVSYTGTDYEGVHIEKSGSDYDNSIVFGGGNEADVTGNTTVRMMGGYVKNRIYGGGNLGSVGTYTADTNGKPETWTTGTGTSTVEISGGEVGLNGMSMPDDWGHVFGAGRGRTGDITVSGNETIPNEAYVDYTNVTISGTAWVKGSVFGGSENGHVRHDTHVTISGGQIGEGQGLGRVYNDTEWTYDGSETAKSLKECASWTYGLATDDADKYAPYDPNANASGYYDDSNTLTTEGGRRVGDDGHTFYGNVFGGGSGYYPYAAGKWLESAGLVEGDTHVTINGGHILTSVYGGNEMTNVGTGLSGTGGKCYITMTDGTIGVPRTEAQIQAHPVTCNLFGAGKGDQRVFFNKSTNVKEVEISVTGGTIYGSVFGGGEDGHVQKDVSLTIGGTAKVGTFGYSGFDGNVFGGGRGFSGDALTAGNVAGCVNLEVSGGHVLGSVYGGGRLASVGYGLFPSTGDDRYGTMRPDNKDDDESNTAVSDFKRGYVNVTISGNAVIGNDTESTLTHTKGGNVYGGSMGRLTLLDGSINDLWPKLARVKEATVTVSGGTINGNVYGGGELGTVTTNTKVEVTSGSGTVNRNIFGGGYGSDDYTTTTDGYTPMQLAGRVDGTATVDIKGGWVKKNVYGGGEMASVGIMTLGEKHESETTSFALSWPYASSYANTTNGNTYVTVTGGRIGMTGKDKMGNKNDKGKDIKEDNGDVYGAGKGIAGDRYIYANCANVNNATVLINYGSTPNPPVATTEDSSDACIAGSVYGGGENGHVIGNANLTMQGGLVGHALYGGGKGKDTYTTTLRVKDASGKKPGEEGYTETTGDVDIYSITAGKVYGKTTVTMSGGRVVRNIYGGGNMASVGKGNYSGGSDDYTTAGYGETITGELWTNTDFMNSGKSTVTISGGTVGAVQTELAEGEDDMKDDLIFGNVFGGCRGESAPNVSQTLSPRIHYYPEFYVGYVNETQVNIQSNAKILGSVYGGGQDGHVRRGTQVNIEGGTIGLAFTDDNRNYLGKNKKGELFKITSDRWQQRGNVYGSGSGIGQYDTGEKDSDGEAIMAYSYSAGSVTQSTEVNITGGTVYKDVYGGGSLSTVGPPKIRQTAEPTKLQTLNTVNIDGGTVGEATGYATGYGGNVYGASRGYSDLNLDQTIFTTTMFTEVNMKSGQVLGSLFGGGEVGIVKGSVNVNVTGGTVGHDVYGGGALADTNTNNPTDADGKLTSTSTYTTTVNLLGGTVGNAYGGGLGDSNTEALVYGDVLVDLNGTTAITTDDTGNKVYTSTPNNPSKRGCVVKGYVFGANNVNGTPKGHVLVHVHGTQNENTDNINTKEEDNYDVKGVFGGGNAADYVPAESDTEQSTEVIIEGCELTSIEEVYGGGYGAATPGTNVLIKGTKIINNVFGGGYGAGNHDDPTASDYNPGANVGYRSDGTTSYGLSDGGKSVIQLMAGTVNHVYGGSNTKGDIRGGSDVTNVTNDGGEGCCTELSVEEIYGGGKSADMFGGAEICLSCMPNDWIGAIYAGAESANVENDVSLTLTSGKFEQVFGGNKSGGEIGGFVEVNIEENPDCSTPIIIGELYGGGNKAAYTYLNLESDPTYQSPRVNVRAFTSIGTIYGGGKGAEATVTGNPMVNINVVEGGRTYAGETKTVDGTKVTIYDRSNDSKMGAIGNVFGGGNAAPVNGNTYVNIATEEYVQMNSVIAGETDVRGYYTRSRSGQGTEADPYVYTYTKVESDTEVIADDTTVYYKPVLGADIRGNVYGGGNAAEVTGKTNVVIGQRIDN